MPEKPKKSPRLTEAALQEQIVEGLRALGYEVLVTSARSVRQGYGADHGVPDLLVGSKDTISWFGLEVKRPGPVEWSHGEQCRLWQEQRTAVVRSFEDAAFALYWASRGQIHPTVRRMGLAFPEDRRGEVIYGE